MRHIRKARVMAKLSASLYRKLDIYGLAATATTIGIAALSPSAQAEVVYTPAHQAVGRHGITIDLNHDGIGDFRMQPQAFFDDSFGVVVYSHAQNRVLGSAVRDFVPNLAAGYQVGPNAGFGTGGTFSSRKTPGKLLYLCGGRSVVSCSGPWDKNTSGYVGFKFSIDGEVHYGWARLTVVPINNTYTFNVYLTGYAYETIANRPIETGKTSGTDAAATGQPASLGMLSAGASALKLWRLSLQ